MSTITREHIENRAKGDPFITSVLKVVSGDGIEMAIRLTNKHNAREDAERRAGREERFAKKASLLRETLWRVKKLKEGDSRMGASLELMEAQLEFALARVIARGNVLPYVDGCEYPVDAKVMMCDEERTICRVCKVEEGHCVSNGCYFKSYSNICPAETRRCLASYRTDHTSVFYLPIAKLLPKPKKPKKPEPNPGINAMLAGKPVVPFFMGPQDGGSPCPPPDVSDPEILGKGMFPDA
jgi:hypothetical protein